MFNVTTDRNFWRHPRPEGTRFIKTRFIILDSLSFNAKLNFLSTLSLSDKANVDQGRYFTRPNHENA